MKIIFCGDSLMQENDKTTYPQVGWPQVLHRYLKPEIGYLNCAINGRSTKSFKDTGLLHVAYSNCNKGDIVLISFGHNDGKESDLTRYTTFDQYEQNLKEMICLFQSKKAHIVLLTPMSRLNYENGVLTRTHKEYPNRMRKVAKEMNIPLIELENYSFEFFQKRNQEQNETYLMTFKENIYPNYMEGKQDHTHLREKGAKVVVKFVKEELSKLRFAKGIFKEAKGEKQ